MDESSQHGPFPVIARASFYYWARSAWGAVGSVAGLILIVVLATRFLRVVQDGARGPEAGTAIVSVIAVGFGLLVAIAIVRFRVTALPDELITTALIRTRHVPSRDIGRVLLRTISYSGSPRKELIVVDHSGVIRTRVLAGFFAEQELRRPFAALGLIAEGSWSDVVTLGPTEGFSDTALASKLSGPKA